MCTYHDLITVLNTLVPAKSKYILDSKSSVHVAEKRKYQTGVPAVHTVQYVHNYQPCIGHNNV
jgi:hypothetical protein